MLKSSPYDEKSVTRRKNRIYNEKSYQKWENDWESVSIESYWLSQNMWQTSMCGFPRFVNGI